MQDEQLHKYKKSITIESKTQAITNTKKFVPRFEPPLYVPAFITMRISLSSKGSSTKGPYTKKLQLGLHKIRVHNSTNSTLYTRGNTKPIEVTKHFMI